MTIVDNTSHDELAHAADLMTIAVRQMGVTTSEAAEAAQMFAMRFTQAHPMVSMDEAMDAHGMLIKALGEIDNTG